MQRSTLCKESHSEVAAAVLRPVSVVHSIAVRRGEARRGAAKAVASVPPQSLHSAWWQGGQNGYLAENMPCYFVHYSLEWERLIKDEPHLSWPLCLLTHIHILLTS